MKASMGEVGNCYDNAVAERVNGILKNEFYLDDHFKNIKQVRQSVKETVTVYNTARPHASCDYLTPEQAHHQYGILKKRWKTYKSTPIKHIVPEDVKAALNQLIRKCHINLS